ncbi:MAG: cysteine dioxygenase family protein [Thermoleophilia bacterium]
MAPSDISTATARNLVCDLHDHHGLPPLAADEFVLDTPFVRTFVATVRERIDRSASAADACEVMRPVFEEALTERDWLPPAFQRDVPDSGMGGGIGQWLLFRSADRSLCLFSLVVPSGSMTPIHDHLAWGLVGLYAGTQDEEFYVPGDGAIELARRRPLVPGDYYVLVPPTDDVHRIRTTSAETSVSIHLLASDTGCVERHTFDEHTGAARLFRSGYANAECEASGVR